MELLTQQILDCLRQGQPFAVATIMADRGSTPRTSGSKMVMLKDRRIYGTVGGGLVEARVMDACLNLLAQGRCRIIELILNREVSDGLDMVCGGSLSVLIETFVPSPELIALFNALLELEKEGRRAFLVSKIEGDSKSDFTTQKWLIPCKNKTAADTDSMTHQVPKALLDAIQDNQFSGSSPVIYNHGMDAYIIEPISMRDKIYIFGAGHVGFQLVRMAQITDFQTIVIDDREEFANRQRFPHVEALHVVDHFDHAFDNLAIDGKSYIVILTRGHLYDQIVLEAAIKTDAAYIGMIGSRTKRDKIYANLERKGISRETLSSVHSPIGLDINSETPAEIAVSIIGEIIKVRRG